MSKTLLKLPADAWRHWLGITGILLTTLFAFMIIAVIIFSAAGMPPGPYSGIVTVLVLPVCFVLSLTLIPIGGWRARRRRKDGKPPGFPVIDLNDRFTFQSAATIIVLSIVNFLLVGAATYRGIVYTNSARFCGTTCHSIMQPEFAVYSRSPHARLECTACHVGTGASRFVRSRMTGIRQIVSTLLDLHPRPIPNPIKELRPARETCEKCHWPERFKGKAIRIHNRYQTDAGNTRLTSVLLLNVGGIDPKTSRYKGIHWHMNPRRRVSYYATDNARMTIPYVEVADLTDNSVKVFSSQPGFRPTSQDDLRVMDCIDCHNRPAHAFEDPSWAVDDALDAGRIPVELPYAKKAVLQALMGRYPTRSLAASGIEDSIRMFFKTQAADQPGTTEERIQAAVAQARTIHGGNVYPEMNIQWGTYPDHLSHHPGPGCFRCHDNAHLTENGESISQDCNLCHSLLATEERDPEILRRLPLAP